MILHRPGVSKPVHSPDRVPIRKCTHAYIYIYVVIAVYLKNQTMPTRTEKLVLYTFSARPVEYIGW